MIGAVGNPIVDYQLTQGSQDRLLAQFQKTPDYTQDVAYYEANIGKVKTPDDLLKDYRLLKVALSAFNLQDAIGDTGILRKLLTQDPTSTKSLAQQLIDGRYRAFANAFSSLRSDGGASISSPTNIDSVLAGYTRYQFQVWSADQTGDSSLRQALYAQQTIQDAVDISNVGNLFEAFKKSPTVSAEADYYKTHIKDVTSVDGFVADRRLVDFALTAYGLDPSKVSTDTVKTLLMQGTSSATSLAAKDPAFLPFAQAFASLQYDGGVSVRATSNIAAVTSSYETSAFQNLLAKGSTADVTSALGSGGADEIAQVYKDFRLESGVTQGLDYYRANIGKISGVDDFIADKKLLDVALTAYGIAPADVTDAKARQLLTEDPAKSGSLASTSAGFGAFAKAFAGLAANPLSAATDTAVGAVADGYAQNLFLSDIGSKLASAQAASSSSTTSGTTAAAGDKPPLSIYQVLADPTLSAVVRGAYGLPSSTAALTVDQQMTALKRAGFDVAKLDSPDAIKRLVQRFLGSVALQQAQDSASSDPTLALFNQGSGDGSVPVDLSFLQTKVTGAAAGTTANGSLVSLFA